MRAVKMRATLPWRDQRIARLDEYCASKERVGTYLRCCLVWAGIVVAFMGCTAAQQKATVHRAAPLVLVDPGQCFTMQSERWCAALSDELGDGPVLVNPRPYKGVFVSCSRIPRPTGCERKEGGSVRDRR